MIATHATTAPLRLARVDHDPQTEDTFGADEGSIRWDLVARLRFAIENDQYDEESRVDALLDRLAADLEP